ncbi:MAG: hypothetical protein ACI3XQ_13005 [Eubacteriales bacterium]
MKKAVKALFCIAFSLVFVFLCVGYAQLSDSLTVNGNVSLSSQDGIYITGVSVPEGADATVNAYISTVLTSTVDLGTDGASTVTLSVTFFNNSDSTYMYDSVTYDSDAYSNANIVFDVSYKQNYIVPHGTLTLDLTFSFKDGVASSLTELYSVLRFNFVEPAKTVVEDDGTNVTNVTVIEGNSADNIGAILDGGTSLDYSTTTRWTTWVENTEGIGIPATLNFVWNNEKTFDSITLYHFVDAGAGTSSDNWKGSCDFPASVEVYYFDDSVGDYVQLDTTNSSTNYSNASRSSRNGVYSMKINNRNVTLNHTYSGEAPATTYTFGSTITTNAVKLVLNPKANYIVGLMEVEFTNS